MQKNVYISNLTIFIPFDNFPNDGNNKINRKENNAWKTLKNPYYIHNPYFECQYKDLLTKEECKNKSNKESKNFKIKFKFSYKQPKRKGFTGDVNCYLLNYKHDCKSKDDIYILAVNFCLDKCFQDENDELYLFDEYDIINLKETLISDVSPEDCISIKIENSLISLKVWLNDIIKKNFSIEMPENTIKYSINEIFYSSLDLDEKINNKEEIDKKFKNKYNNNGKSFSVNSYFVKNFNKFIVGLLDGNENFENLSSKYVDNIIENNYTNNKYDNTYSIGNNIVFTNVHNPYKFIENKDKGLNDRDLGDFKYIREICAIIYINNQIKKIGDILNRKYINSESFFTFRIESNLLNLKTNIYKNIFSMREADLRMNFLYKNMGINEDLQKIEEIGNTYAHIRNMKIINMFNIIMVLLTFATLFKIPDENYNFIILFLYSVIIVLLFIIFLKNK